jgi:pyridoxine 4-dehydrogenase
LQSDLLRTVAARRESTPMSVPLPWLLRRSPNILLIPGTRRRSRTGAGLVLTDSDYAELDAIAGSGDS